MKFKQVIALSCFLSSVFAYSQSDLLAAQNDYQSASDKVTLAKQEKQDASAALTKARQRLDKAQKELQEAQQQLAKAQKRAADADASLTQKNRDFGAVNQHLNQVWDSLNAQSSNN
jgi:chromosome segregation ATPase